MQLLNTKTLLVIAALLASLLGILARQEMRSAREEQRKADIAKHNKEFWEQVEKNQQNEPVMSMDEDLKKHRIY